MKLPLLSKRSLRANLVMGVLAMLLPWVMFALVEGHLLFPKVIGAFQDVVQTSSTQLERVSELHALLRKAAIAPAHYAIDGDSRARADFAQTSAEIDKGFKAVMKSYADTSVRQQMLIPALEAWQRAKRLARGLLARPAPVDRTVGIRAIDAIHVSIRSSQDLLDQMRGRAQQQAAASLREARLVMTQVEILVAVIFAAAMAMAAASGFGLARSILAPLRSLEEGAHRLGEGNLGYRVSVDGQDELQELAGAFNSMAERLERSQSALEELSARDGLTGLYNHREFQRRLDEEVGRHHRYGRPFSVLMLDLDRFKSVNDEYGHPVGDEVLRNVAARICRELRPADQVARYGGEEFAVILAETPGDGAMAVAERIRQTLAGEPVALGDGRHTSITVSIGVAAFPEDASAAEEVIVAADDALYAAKRAGRNQAMRFTRRRPAEESVV